MNQREDRYQLSLKSMFLVVLAIAVPLALLKIAFLLGLLSVPCSIILLVAYLSRSTFGDYDKQLGTTAQLLFKSRRFSISSARKQARGDTHKPEAILLSLTPLVLERFLPSLTLWLSRKRWVKPVWNRE